MDRYAEDIEVILQKNFDKSLVTVIYLTDAVEVAPILGPLQNLKGGGKMKGISVAGIAVLSIDRSILQFIDRTISTAIREVSKFGLFLTLISQRPRNIDPDILSTAGPCWFHTPYPR